MTTQAITRDKTGACTPLLLVAVLVAITAAPWVASAYAIQVCTQ